MHDNRNFLRRRRRSGMTKNIHGSPLPTGRIFAEHYHFFRGPSFGKINHLEWLRQTWLFLGNPAKIVLPLLLPRLSPLLRIEYISSKSFGWILDLVKGGIILVNTYIISASKESFIGAHIWLRPGRLIAIFWCCGRGVDNRVGILSTRD